ncbi:hypothetical protein MMC30_003961 [Trapelia coarctata]|nr:hypothetical protein [Trapelia coarctata]
MRFLSNPAYASLFLYLTSVLASPFPGDGVEYRLSLRWAGPDPPLPGRSGVSTDANGESWAHYGDDDLPEHARHTDRNQEKHPENREALPLAEGGQAAVNRKNALKGIDPAGTHPVAGWPRVKDEKLPAMLDNPNHDDKTTVEYRSGIESGGMKWTTKEPPTKDHPLGQEHTYKRPDHFKTEGVLLGELSRTMEDRKAAGLPANGGVKSNKGWLPLPKDMTRAHTMDDSFGTSNNGKDGKPLTVAKPGDPPKPPGNAPKQNTAAAKKGPKAPKKAGSSSATNAASSLAHPYPTRGKKTASAKSALLGSDSKPAAAAAAAAKKAAITKPKKGAPKPPTNLGPGTPAKKGPAGTAPPPPPGNPPPNPPPPGSPPKKDPNWASGPRPSNPETRIPSRPQNAQSGPQKPFTAPPKPPAPAPPKKALEAGDKPRDTSPLKPLDIKMPPKPKDAPASLPATPKKASVPVPVVAPQTPPRVNEPPKVPGAPKKEEKKVAASAAPPPQTPQNKQNKPPPPGAPKKAGGKARRAVGRRWARQVSKRWARQVSECWRGEWVC